MNRYFVFALLALIALGAWFARPGGGAQASAEPLVVDAPPAQVIGQVHALRLQDAFKREPVAGGFETFASDLTSRHDESAPRREVVSLMHGADRIAVVTVDVARDDDQSSLTVTVDLPRSPLTSQSALRPRDREALAKLIDITITDYIGAMLDARAPASSDAIRDALDEETGMDIEDHAAFARRVTQAMELAFGAAAPTAAPETSSAAEPDDLDSFYGEGAPSDESPGDLGNAPAPDNPAGEQPQADDPARDADEF